MTENRRLSVSVTINLGNEENLKLEVTDIAETLEDASQLRKFLADVLDGYGKNNTATRSVIESYKERLLLENTSPVEPIEEMPFIPDDIEADDEPAFEPLPDITPAPAVASAPEAPTIPMFMGAAASDDKYSVGPLFEPVEQEREYPPVMPSPAPIHKPEEPSIEYVCSKCGAPVTKSQHDFSMLFNHKILCKNCMK